MARGRIIDKNISTSKKVAKVTDKSALLYTWLISHTDDFGSMDGDAFVIKAKVVPMRLNWTLEDVETSIVELVQIGLLIKYEVEQETFVRVINFDSFQTFRTDRPRRAEYPAPLGIPLSPNGKSVGENRQRKLSEGKGREVKGSKGKRSKDTLHPPDAPNPHIKTLIDFFHDAVKGIRGHDPVKENGGKIGSLLKKRLEKDLISVSRIEKMIVWYLTRKKRDKDEKENWHETYKNAPDFGVMLSDAFFSALLTDEINQLSFMSDNYVNLEKIYAKINRPAPSLADLKKMTESLAKSKTVEIEKES